MVRKQIKEKTNENFKLCRKSLTQLKHTFAEGVKSTPYIQFIYAVCAGINIF